MRTYSVGGGFGGRLNGDSAGKRWHGPFSERGLDQEFGSAIRLRSAGFDLDVLDAELLTGGSEGLGELAATIISHDAPRLVK